MKILQRPKRVRLSAVRLDHTHKSDTRSNNSLGDCCAWWVRRKPKLCLKGQTITRQYRQNDDQVLQRKNSKVKASTYFLLDALKASCRLRDLENGRIVHAHAAETGEELNTYVAATLVNMYAKCGSLFEAQRVFDAAKIRRVVPWTALILGYAENGDGDHALELFQRMRSPEGCEPDARAYLAALKACICVAEKERGERFNGKLLKLVSLEKAMEIHAGAVKSKCDSDMFVGSSLVDLYASCGSTEDARKVFERIKSPDVVAWTSMIQAYAENGEADLALKTFMSLKSSTSSDCEVDARAFVSAIKACSSLAGSEATADEIAGGKFVKIRALAAGMEIHSEAVKRGVDSDTFVASVLVDMYSKCGSLLDARMAFDRMKSFNVVSLSSLILGYSENGESDLALDLLLSCLDSQADNRLVVHPDAWTLAAALKACVNSASFEGGKRVHAEICRLGLENDAIISTCLLDLYCKCGNMVNSQQVFDSSLSRDSVTWNALIAGFSHQGDTEKTFELFDQMVEEGIDAVGASCVCLLTACSHAGFVDKGRKFFREMKMKYGVEAGIEHYHCLVDLLCRGNELEEAVEVVREMPYEASVVSWRTVLGGCYKWNNVGVAREAFERLMEVHGGEDATAYMLMANICCQKTVSS